MHSLSAMEAQIKCAKTIAILSHNNPDADAFCSAIALKRMIKHFYPELNQKIDIFIDTDEICDLYKPIVLNEPLNQQPIDEYDLAIGLDAASISRFGKYANIFTGAQDTINIDHHQTNEKFANNNLILLASSTCEALYTLFKCLDKEIPTEVHKFIYAGIITDTNNLEKPTNIKTHEILKELLFKNKTLDSIREYFFNNISIEKESLMYKALESREFFEDGRIAFMKLLKQDFSQTNASYDDSLGIVDYCIKIKNVQIAVIAIKQRDNSYYISIRTKNNVDAAEIAQLFNGGGHATMAAFHFTGSLTDLKRDLIKQCKSKLEVNTNNVVINNDLFL